jgi:hypothetical protein
VTTTRIQAMAMAVLTMITLAFVIMIPKITDPKITDPKINCSNPTTWSTAQGVEHCAVNGGK